MPLFLPEIVVRLGRVRLKDVSNDRFVGFGSFEPFEPSVGWNQCDLTTTNRCIWLLGFHVCSDEHRAPGALEDVGVGNLLTRGDEVRGFPIPQRVRRATVAKKDRC